MLGAACLGCRTEELRRTKQTLISYSVQYTQTGTEIGIARTTAQVRPTIFHCTVSYSNVLYCTEFSIFCEVIKVPWTHL